MLGLYDISKMICTPSMRIQADPNSSLIDVITIQRSSSRSSDKQISPKRPLIPTRADVLIYTSAHVKQKRRSQKTNSP